MMFGDSPEENIKPSSRSLTHNTNLIQLLPHSMGMQNGDDPTVRNSSIALLQERFRQLQRAKEMREERELFRLLAETVRVNPAAYYYEPFFHGEIYQPSSQPTIKLQPYLLFMHKDVESKETPVLDNLWSKNTVMHRPIALDDEHSDVDTSLHL